MVKEFILATLFRLKTSFEAETQNLYSKKQKQFSIVGLFEQLHKHIHLQHFVWFSLEEQEDKLML